MTGRSNKTVNRIIQAYRKEGRISDAPHRRHPRETTAAQDADNLDAAKASPFSTAREIGAAAGVSASASTIKRRLAEGKLKSHVAAQKPRLSLSNKTAQLRNRTLLFSDESTFTTHWDQKQCVWRPANSRYDPLYVQEVASSGCTAVNVWGAVSRDGLGVLHRVEGPLTSARYCDILDYIMIPYALDGTFPDGDFLFQQDLSPVHTAKVVEELLNMRGVRCLRWVPKGADLNIIEAVWGRMKVSLCKRGLHSSSADELWSAVEEEWMRLQNELSFVDNLYASLQSRMQDVIAVQGAMTHY
ncbi:hypothetical protein HPB52_002229 [Rhipicephalus sanguineus]|uniref:Uncharacterized protein n=1 Tax=Rhipicephalus sanguineus TaxID=34632 RepID=A0A9D4T2E8_RHISA|nr:hypothetical protein HPB52_002229 [Rhipicephalus sanguineus]